MFSGSGLWMIIHGNYNGLYHYLIGILSYIQNAESGVGFSITVRRYMLKGFNPRKNIILSQTKVPINRVQ